MKKIRYIGFGAVVTVLLILINPVSIGMLTLENDSRVSISTNLDDELDQYQDQFDKNTNRYGHVINYYRTVAQSFKPTVTVLTRVEVCVIIPDDVDGNLKCAIKEELTGEDLTFTEKTARELRKERDPSHTSQPIWIEFDFPDIETIPEKTYYIVCSDYDDRNGFYSWMVNGDSHSYSRGSVWVSSDQCKSWEERGVDSYFRTYGTGKDARPYKPELNGPNSGKPGVEYPYTTSTTDPDGDQIYYLFDWGDGSDSGWLGPYDSGYLVKTNHVWDQRGSYKIKVKAKDIYGAESDWKTLHIIMSKNKPLNIQKLLILFEKLDFLFLAKLLTI